MGCPSFVAEPPGDGYKRNPQVLEDIKDLCWQCGSLARRKA
jgi:hypothetical protein